MTKDERLYLESLSFKLYGSKGKYLKMITKGEKAPMEEIMEDGTQRKYTGIHYSTLAEIKKIMEELSTEEDELKTKELEAKKELEAEALKQAREREMKRLEEKYDPVKDVLETVGD